MTLAGALQVEQCQWQWHQLLATLLPVIMTVIPTKDKDFGASDRDLPNNPCFPGRGLPTQARDSGSRGSLSGALQERKLEEQDSDKPGRANRTR